MSPASTPRDIVRVETGRRDYVTDDLVSEAPLEIRIGSVPLAVLIQTPGFAEDLVRGFALTEGIAASPAEIDTITYLGEVEGDQRWEIVMEGNVDVDPEQFRRNIFSTSSCGVCGKASIDAVRIAAAKVDPGPRIDSAQLLQLSRIMKLEQAEFARTGAIHAAALFDHDGKLLIVREDIGRHNAVDKAIGRVSREVWPISNTVLVVSGRVSFEITQKAAVAGIPVVAGVSAASDLAVDLGVEFGMTVIGFLRDSSFNIYCGEERIVGS